MLFLDWGNCARSPEDVTVVKDYAVVSRGGSRCKSDGCQGHVVAKPPQDVWGGGEAPERHGGPGAEPPEIFLGSTPFKFAEHITTPFLFLQLFRQLIAILLRLFRIWTTPEWEDGRTV